MKVMRRLGLCLCAIALAGVATPARAGDLASEVKAAVVYNFANFTTWPESQFAGPDAPLRLCIFERRPLDGALEALDGTEVGARRLSVRRATRGSAADCDIAFLGDIPVKNVDAMLQSLAGRPVLTIAHQDRFCERGGMLNLFVLDGKVRFQANPDAIQKSGVAVSAQVLKLAQIVSGRAQ